MFRTRTFNDASLGPRLLLLALGAAAFGAFTSLPRTLGGGLLIGVAQQYALRESSSAPIAESETVESDDREVPALTTDHDCFAPSKAVVAWHRGA